VEKCSWARRATNAFCLLDNQSYRHTLGICNTFCFSTGKVVSRTRLSITFIGTLSVLYSLFYAPVLHTILGVGFTLSCDDQVLFY
jgi:hypothetical protein